MNSIQQAASTGSRVHVMILTRPHPYLATCLAAPHQQKEISQSYTRCTNILAKHWILLMEEVSMDVYKMFSDLTKNSISNQLKALFPSIQKWSHPWLASSSAWPHPRVALERLSIMISGNLHLKLVLPSIVKAIQLTEETNLQKALEKLPSERLPIIADWTAEASSNQLRTWMKINFRR